MELKKIKEEENPLLNRKRIVYESSGKTPKREDVLEKISALTGKEKDAISIKSITQAYGSSTSVIEANVYESVEDRKKYEPIKEGKTDETKK